MTGLQEARRNSFWGLLSSVFAQAGPWVGGKRERSRAGAWLTMGRRWVRGVEGGGFF